MTLEQALNAWLTSLTGLDCYWLKRPINAENAIVYRCISPSMVEGNLSSSGVKQDSYTITVYHSDPDVGKQLADQITKELHHFCGSLDGYEVQLVTFSSGFDQSLESAGRSDAYQFNRDFLIHH